MSQEQELFLKLKNDLLSIDPCFWCEKYLTLDGAPFRVHGGGYRPLADIYRYVGIKALEPNSKPLIIVKSRQVGMTTMAAALEMYFMGNGTFGVNGKPPIRIMHAFPQLEHGAAYSKTKLESMISASVRAIQDPNKQNAKSKSYMQNLLEKNASGNDSFGFKRFINGNHIFIDSIGMTADRLMGKTTDVLFYDEIQKMTDDGIANASKILTTAKYGNKGVKVYFGTPLRQGSSFHKRWQASTQQYYHLGCESCKQHFPLYQPNSDSWEKVWLHGFIVKCTHCGFEQDKRDAAERGKWVAIREEQDSELIGFHVNILYNPTYTKEEVLKEKPENSIINTTRAFQNEVMGEFYQGDSSPITTDEIREKCADFERKMSAVIHPRQDQIVVMGIDYGGKRDAGQLANPEKSKGGLSYSTAVILSVSGAGLLSIEFANKFKENGQEYKKSLIEKLYRDYSVQLAVGDIGYSNDFSETLHNMYGDKYLVSRSQGKVNNYVKYNEEAFPKEICFERDHYIGELYEQLKKGQIRFPYGSYEKIAWLVEHCASMELKASLNRSGEAGVHYVKGNTPNDGFAALLNAYIAYKFIITNGFKIKGYVTGINGFNAAKKQPHALLGNISRKF